MGTETPYLSGVFRFVARLHTLSKRGMRMALAGQPKCRYGMLQSLYNLIEQHGCDGAIYVSDIARQMHQPMPAISSGLRQMEQDGHIVRETDPKDRRKTLVRITPAGERARKANEQAMNDYFARIMARLTPEQLAQYGKGTGVQGISAADAHSFLAALDADTSLSPRRSAAARAAVS